MKFESDTKPKDYLVSGNDLLIRFDVSEDIRNDIDGSPRTVFSGEEVVVSPFATKDQIIEAIVASRYSTADEIALNRKSDGDLAKTEYLGFVSKAKVIASYTQSLVKEERNGAVISDAEKEQRYSDALSTQSDKDKNAQTLTVRQAHQALIELGKDDEVETTIRAIPDQKQYKTIRNWYENSTSWIYGNPVLTQFAAVMNIDKDEFFALAKTL